MKTKTLALLLTLSSLGMVTACSGAKEKLGLNKKAPNEFAVVKRAPLSMPPGFQLDPPKPGAPRPQEQTPNEQAKQAIFGSNEDVASYQPSSSEELFLQQAGADIIQNDIRKKVDQESTEYDHSKTPVVKRLLNFGESKPPADIINARKELERLKKNQAEGKALTDGETPTINE